MIDHSVKNSEVYRRLSPFLVRKYVSDLFERKPKERGEREREKGKKDMWRNSAATVRIRHLVSLDNDVCMHS